MQQSLSVPLVYGPSIACIYAEAGSLNGFYRSIRIPVVHAVATCLLSLLGFSPAALSLSLAYFTIDLPACVVNRDVGYSIHACLGLVLVSWGFSEPCMSRDVPKLLLVELSTPFYYLWKKQKDKSSFGAFIIAFFCCRLLLIPPLTYRVLDQGLVLPLTLFLFYCLNLCWFYRMWNMYHNYADPEHRFNLCLLPLLAMLGLVLTGGRLAGLFLITNRKLVSNTGWKAAFSPVNGLAAVYIARAYPESTPGLALGLAAWVTGLSSGSQLAHVLLVQIPLLFALYAC